MFDIDAIKIGDKVGLGPKHKKAQAYGIVRAITIQPTVVEYKVEITDVVISTHKKHKSTMMTVTHHQIRRETNEPDALMKEIL